MENTRDDVELYIKVVNLLVGYNLVTKDGMVIRKRTFVSTYPELAKKLVADIYSNYDTGKLTPDIENDEPFDFKQLKKDVDNSIGFSIIRTKNQRSKK